MKRYAIYDLASGQILQTVAEVDVSGRHKTLSDEDVLGTLHPSVDRETVGVTAVDIHPTIGKGPGYRIDPTTRKLASR